METVVTSLGEKVSGKNFFASRAGPLKRTEQGRDEKTQQRHLLWYDGNLLSGLQPGMRKRKKTTLHLQKMDRRCRVVFLLSFIPGWTPERRPPSFCSRWRCWVFSSLPCFCPFYRSILTWNEVFFQKLFPLVSVLFWGISKSTSKQKTKSFLASNEAVSARHLQLPITLPTNRFMANDECVLCGGMSTFNAGDEYFTAGNERIENVRSSFSHTHAQLGWSAWDYSYTCSYQRLLSKIYVEMIIYIATYLGNGCYHVVGIQKVSRCTTYSDFGCTELVLKAK